jgi:mono/diheme cytochrome c family protein
LICLILGAGLLAAPATVYAQSTIKWVSMKTLNDVDGKYIYDRECAVCHGSSGKGNGKAARLVDVPVPDLTLIAARDGEFNQFHVLHHVVDQRTDRDRMPNWGHNFEHAFTDHRAGAEIASRNLLRHVEAMQRTVN